jgi:hypothetical protein
MAAASATNLLGGKQTWHRYPSYVRGEPAMGYVQESIGSANGNVMLSAHDGKRTDRVSHSTYA